MVDTVTIKTSKVLRNPLLKRRQMVVTVAHPGLAIPSKKTISEQLSKAYGVDTKLISLFGFHAAFGGGSSSGFALIYDDEEAFKAFEPRHRRINAGLATKKTRSRKQWKDLKKKKRTTWGTGRRAAARQQRKAAAS